MKNWIELCSDVNWEDYHGMWARKAPDGSWYVLVWTNLWDAAGESEDLDKYECQVERIDVHELPGKEVKSALDSCGYRIVNTRVSESCVVSQIESDSGDEIANNSVSAQQFELALVECCIQYGLGAPLESFSGSKYPKRIRAEARRYAEECMRDDALLERQLDRPVNRLGSTAREYGLGDIDAALHRGPFDTAKNIMRKLHGLPPGSEQ